MTPYILAEPSGKKQVNVTKGPSDTLAPAVDIKAVDERSEGEEGN
jgi:hypothetical protein